MIFISHRFIYKNKQTNKQTKLAPSETKPLGRI